MKKFFVYPIINILTISIENVVTTSGVFGVDEKGCIEEDDLLDD